MDWSHAWVAITAFLAPYIPTVGARLDQWFQAWLKAKYGPKDNPNPFRASSSTSGQLPSA